MSVIVIGNPKLDSRTLHAAARVHEAITGSAPAHNIEIAALGPGVLGWGDPDVKAAVQIVQSATFAVVASPTFKATYSGLLKVFLDQFAGGEGLRDVVVVPLMLGAGPTHALAPELLLKPVLSELGATTPSPGLYLRDSSYDTDGAIEAYAERWGSTLMAASRNATVQKP
ncbi:NADPH-dependent FMN reductase [Paenarthrobacter sp. YAF11_1]|uniref:NADPH-dependent FMN reductase n=1 Tax=Paenarthrobacter sp. YAF11_1 TaxID=3233074 RepID=UPI003F972409